MSERPQIGKIAVLGAGSWGTALANVAARAGHDVYLWGRNSEDMREIADMRENRRYLPGIAVEAGVSPITDIACTREADAILLVVPAQAQRAMAATIAPFIRNKTPVVICAKGIERGTQLFMGDAVAQVLPQTPLALLSGPSFADDVARGLPTAVTIAATNVMLARDLAEALGTSTFRLYHTDDMRGVEIGGSAKNVLAIACGIAKGCGLGASANAALIARGFAELRRFGAAYGARSETLMGLSGLGDLVLTCSSEQSRNFAFGVALGRGKSVTDASGGKLAEGAYTASVLVQMARAKNIELPICNAVDALIEGRIDVRRAIESLLSRPQRGE
jgi:glycerol-3-phosphate dehydrogenase (NAD(P)+)